MIRMRHPKALELVIARMDALPAKPEEGLYGEASTLGAMVQRIDDPRGWSALEQLTRRSEPVQRIEIFRNLDDWRARGEGKRHRIEFLAKFQNDNALVVFGKESSFEVPGGYPHLKQMTVGDAALRELSYSVGMKDWPGYDWKPEDLDAWRPMAQAALRRYLDASAREK
jgi:hypothetical protein